MAKIKLKLSEYRYIVPAFLIFLEKGNTLARVTEFAVVSMIPVICLLHYYGETFGFTEELNGQIESVIKFYDYEVVK